MMDVLGFAIGAAVMAAAVFAGRGARRAVHAILPHCDPFFMATLAAEMAAGIYCFASGLSIPDIAVTALAFWDAGYLLGYMTAHAGDVIYVDVPDGGLTASDIGPLVVYWHGGEQWWMPQTLGSVIRSFLGARDPLDAPLGIVRNVRRVTATNGFYPAIKMNVIPVSMYSEEVRGTQIASWGHRKMKDVNGNKVDTGEPKHRIVLRVRAKTLRFAQEVVDDPEAFWTKSGIYLEAVNRAQEASGRATRLEVQMQSAVFDAGAQVVAGLISLQEDAPGTKDEVLAAVRAERARRENPAAAAEEVDDAEDQRRWGSGGRPLWELAHAHETGRRRLPPAGGRPVRVHRGGARRHGRAGGREDPHRGAGAGVVGRSHLRGAPSGDRRDGGPPARLLPGDGRPGAGAAVGARDRGPRSPDRPGRALGPDGRLRGPRSL